MADHTTYLVDSDVLITAKNLYYALDLCPDFGGACFTITEGVAFSALTESETSFSSAAVTGCNNGRRNGLNRLSQANELPRPGGD